MKASNTYKFLAGFILSTSLVGTLVQAQNRESAREYQEVTYDELLNELSSKKNNLNQQSSKSPFDGVMIHAGLGYVNAFSNFKTSEHSMSRYQNGLQLSLGIDLFSPNWYSEGVFRNYGTTSQGNEEINLKEFDLKVGYKAPITSLWAYSMSTGLANRFLRINDPGRNINVNDTTPSLIMSGGLFATPNRNISFGFELNARSPLVSSTADKDSFDFALRVITSL